MSGFADPPTSGASHAFRPDLEGLRAVAVGLVLLYHARVGPFGGGYVGVDVFFVLSGFLITGLIVRELEKTGRVSIPAFYARRARRLLPAAALVLVVTAVASALILPPLRMPDVTTDIASAAAYVSNVRFALQATNYLASDLPPSPVLHYWSLGVEEQFYLFWPALLAVVSGAAWLAGDTVRGNRRIGVTLGVVLVGSLALSIWLTGVEQPWAFFSLPTRAWELALGGLLAMPAATRLAGRRGVPFIGWIGLLLVVASGLVLTDGTAFPGLAALLPTVGSGLVIFGGLAGTRGGPAPLLSLPPMRYLGRISYSLYLWHWPVLVLPAVALGTLSGPVRVGLAGLAVLLAAICQRLVEDPIRRGRLVGLQPGRSLAMAGALSVVVAGSALWLGSQSVAALQTRGAAVGGSIDDVPALPPLGSARAPSATDAAPGPEGSLPPLIPNPLPADLVPSLETARQDLPPIYDDGCHADPPVTAPAAGCFFGDTASATTIVLFGDSHAAQWFPALDRIATEHGWRLLSVTKSACASVDVPVWSELFNRPYLECDSWRQHAFDLITSVHPVLVVLANDRNYSLTVAGRSAPERDHPDLWSSGLTATIQRLSTTGARVVVIGDTPRQASDPLDCLSAHLGDASVCSTSYVLAVDTDFERLEWQATEAAGSTFIDPTSWVCFNDPCPSVIGRFLVYRDTHHLTATYSRALAPQLFALLGIAP